MVKRFTVCIAVIFMISLVLPVVTTSNIAQASSDRPRTSITCATSPQLLGLSKHAKNHVRYKCKPDKRTIREAIDEMDNSDIYYDDEKNNGFWVRFPGEIIFDNGKADLTEEAKSTLERFGKAIRDYSNKITVNGHASTPNINTEEFPSNQVLSEARAEEVADYLSNLKGIHSYRFDTRGYGEEFPYVDEIDAETERINRRVDFFVKN